DRWFAEQARTLHGVDLRRGVRRYRAELLAVWPEHVLTVAPDLRMTLHDGRLAVPSHRQGKWGGSSTSETVHCSGDELSRQDAPACRDVEKTMDATNIRRDAAI